MGQPWLLVVLKPAEQTPLTALYIASLFKEVCSLPPATKLGQGYIFTGVCDSVNGGGGVCSQGCLLLGEGVCSRGVSAPGGGGCLLPGGVPGGDPLGRPLLRAVRILLECILVDVFL